jgi:hypothetical protein
MMTRRIEQSKRIRGLLQRVSLSSPSKPVVFSMSIPVIVNDDLADSVAVTSGELEPASGVSPFVQISWQIRRPCVVSGR